MASTMRPAKTLSLKRLFFALLFPLLMAVSIVSQPAQAATAYQYPCSAYRLSGYNFGQYVSGWGYHVGQDVACRAGMPIYAVADGTVVYSAKTPNSYRWGNLVLIQHVNPDGSQVTSLYGHMGNDRRVAAGQGVAKGQLIGFVGPAFTADNGNWGDHLHFAIHHGPYAASVGSYAPNINGYVPANRLGEYADPGAYINARQNMYDYVAYNIIGGGATSKTQEHYVDFQLRNTGSTTWQINGPNAVRLGTIGPRDRASGFSVGQIGQGWASANRIALMNETPPGGVGVFRAKFSNRAVQSGRYTEYFAPVIDGQGWMADRRVGVTVDVGPPNNRAAPYGQGVYPASSPTVTTGAIDPIYQIPGQKLNLKAYIQNVGDTAWSRNGPHPVRLGTNRGNDRPSSFATGGNSSIPLSENWPWYNRASDIDGRYNPGNNTVTNADTINPGEIAVFSFTATIPNEPGYYVEYFNPVMEGVSWLNDLGLNYRIRVLQPGYHYEYVGQANPGPVALGKGSAQAVLYVRNVGQKDWPVGGNLRLGTDRPRDRSSSFKAANWPSSNRLAAVDANATNPGKPVINSGEVGRFTLTFTDNDKPDGQYQEYVRPVMDGEGWLPEDYGIYFPITVKSADYDYQVLDQRFDQDISSLRDGDVRLASLAIRNLGAQSWPTSGSSPVRLATERPKDRASGFSLLNGNDPWLSANRPSTIDGKVVNLATLETVAAAEIRQGEIGFFNIPIKVPAGLNPGSYPEYFNLVKEGLTWLPDYGIYFPLQVTGQ